MTDVIKHQSLILPPELSKQTSDASDGEVRASYILLLVINVCNIIKIFMN